MGITNYQKIKVAMYCPYFLPAYGGAEVATFNLARRLRTFCDVKLYAFNWIQSLDPNKHFRFDFSKLPEQKILNGVSIYRYSVTNLPIVKSFSLKMMKDIKFCDADIVHFQGTTRLFSSLLLQKIVKNKIKILTTHGLQESIEIIRQSRLNVLINSFFVHSLRNLDYIIALSKLDVNLLLYLGLNKNKIAFIPNGIDVTKFKNRRKFVERNGKMKILCVARFDKNKNYESLIYALSKLKNDIDFEAYFIGAVTDYEYFKKIMTLIKKNKLERCVKIGVSLDDPALADCYLSCDLFVLPSTVETFGLVILEAMYAGLPIVSTPVGYVPEIVKDGVNGFLVPKNDPVELYTKCLQLLKNETMRHQIGKKNKEIAKNYTWSKIAARTYDIYQGLMEKPSRNKA